MESIGHRSTIRLTLPVLLLAIAAWLAPALAAEPEAAPAAAAVDAPIVTDLKQLLALRPDIEAVLTESLGRADWNGVTTLEAYYGYLNAAVRRIPHAETLLEDAMGFYYLINQSDALRASEPFQQWVIRFAQDWGSFLDTPASLAAIQSFYADPGYRMDDYYVGPGGWQNYNQFFAREIKPGRRPVEGRCDETVIVSPADSVFLGTWPITDNATIEVKGVNHSIPALLEGSPYADAFKGGVFTHAFLNVNDYHRFHTPVAGKVLEQRAILGKMVLEVTRKPDGGLEPPAPV
jgi:hypothetical protein